MQGSMQSLLLLSVHFRTHIQIPADAPIQCLDWVSPMGIPVTDTHNIACMPLCVPRLFRMTHFLDPFTASPTPEVHTFGRRSSKIKQNRMKRRAQKDVKLSPETLTFNGGFGAHPVGGYDPFGLSLRLPPALPLLTQLKGLSHRCTNLP